MRRKAEKNEEKKNKKHEVMEGGGEQPCVSPIHAPLGLIY